ncbi:MAG: hypothetical protein IID50_11190, partial [Proteobacteria bacterium]|nr:hypothetical protein [Pseudomonadota bacterium]
LPRLSDGVAHASRCPASPQRTLRAENLGKPARRVMISAPWYKTGGVVADGEGDTRKRAREIPPGGTTPGDFFWTSHPLFVYVLGICRGIYPGG